jgi:crossover junction endodeoxyribonuclease RuvC
MPIVIGIDPGLQGGIAVIETIGPTLVACTDIPLVGVKAKERVDVLAVKQFIDAHKPVRAFIERGGTMPKQGISSAFKYGHACGQLETVITLCEIPLEIIEPSVWKRFYKLAGKDKEGGRQKALQLFPSAHSLLALRKHQGRGEAALLALYGAQK